MFNNCRRYLLDEIAVLQPDILITHGKKAEENVMRLLGKEASPTKTPRVFICKAPHGDFFWLQTPHPSRGGRVDFLAQKRDWQKYIKLMQQFYARKQL